MNARAFGVLVAVVASCGPRWTLEDRTQPVTVTLSPSTEHAKDLTIEASHPIPSVRTIAERISVTSGRIRVTHADARSGCNAEATYEGRDGLWNVASTIDGGSADGGLTLTSDRIELSSRCTATEHATKVTLRFVNEGDAPVTFSWQVVATTNGEGSDDPPSDAFIRVRPAQ